MPLLNFYGKYDHLVPPAACELLTRKAASRDTEDVCLNTGHIGIYVSSKCQREFAPKIAAWLKARDADEKKRRPKKSAAGKVKSGKTAAKNKYSA
jgi:polyhydroxyalkanoate synthase